jgi:biopolymer transport protein ExbD
MLKSPISFRNRQDQRSQPKTLDLQITSLADILVVVLVFLLKSLSGQFDVDISVPTDIRLPQANTTDKGEEGIKIEVSETAIKVEGRSIASLKSFRFEPSDLNQDLENSSSSKSLSNFFYRKSFNDGERRIWVLAHKKTPYKTIQTVLASAAIYGFVDIKLAVIKDGY